jgi:Zinc-binding dehydrogenase
MAGHVAWGRLTMPIAAVYPLEQVRAAYTELAGGHVYGKIVLATEMLRRCLLLAAECPIRDSKIGVIYKSVAPDPGSCTSARFADARQGRSFFVHGTGAGKTLRSKDGENPGRILSHRDLPSMTDYRVPTRSLT